jgi:hypothetical protein
MGRIADVREGVDAVTKDLVSFPSGAMDVRADERPARLGRGARRGGGGAKELRAFAFDPAS